MDITSFFNNAWSAILTIGVAGFGYLWKQTSARLKEIEQVNIQQERDMAVLVSEFKEVKRQLNEHDSTMKEFFEKVNKIERDLAGINSTLMAMNEVLKELRMEIQTIKRM